MDNNNLIKKLKAIPDLFGICPYCMDSFRISDAFLFDSLCDKFPKTTKDICKQYHEDLKIRTELLKTYF